MEFHGHHSERFFPFCFWMKPLEDTWRILMRHLIIQRKFQIQVLLSESVFLKQDLFCHSVQGFTQFWGHLIGFSNLIYHHEKNFLKIECE